MKTLKKELLYLPTPVSLSYSWNFGSLLGVCLSFQLVTGVLLSLHFTSEVETTFDSVSHIVYDMNYGCYMRFAHANGATLFFVCTYTHIGRGLYYKSYQLVKTWTVGVAIYLMLMAIAFLGYVLPWGQMSLWGATVITNLISVVPFIGGMLVEWVWGGFSVGGPTLTRFFSLHFLTPMVLVVFILVHLVFLHSTGSSNPLGLSKHSDKIMFHPNFSYKDYIGILGLILCLTLLVEVNTFSFMDPENFIKANPLMTPNHIKPEWYFLYAYAILRSVPSKLGGIMALLCSILLLMILPLSLKSKFPSIMHKRLCAVTFSLFSLLTWVGGLPVEAPYVVMGQVLSVLYMISMMLLLVV